ncbi:MAG TPA: hypothetical protein VGI48_01765 [Caldimonas sp.]
MRLLADPLGLYPCDRWYGRHAESSNPRIVALAMEPARCNNQPVPVLLGCDSARGGITSFPLPLIRLAGQAPSATPRGADIDGTRLGFDMARAIFPSLFLAVLMAVHAVAAAAGDRPASNTFMLLAAAPARPAPQSMPSNGVGIGPGKPVVSNPYQVPLLQNAGSLRGAR